MVIKKPNPSPIREGLCVFPRLKAPRLPASSLLTEPPTSPPSLSPFSAISHFLKVNKNENLKNESFNSLIFSSCLKGIVFKNIDWAYKSRAEKEKSQDKI